MNNQTSELLKLLELSDHQELVDNGINTFSKKYVDNDVTIEKVYFHNGKPVEHSELAGILNGH